MAVPDYQSLLLPLLQIAGDRQEHRLREVIEELGQRLRLSEADRKALLPSGRQAMFDNGAGWALTYLKKAGWLESTGRGRFRITERGVRVLEGSPAGITARFLEQFPEFLEFRSASGRGAKRSDQNVAETARTPEETLESSHQQLRRELAHELLEQVRRCSPAFFERLVVDLLVAMGYGGSRQDAGHRLSARAAMTG